MALLNVMRAQPYNIMLNINCNLSDIRCSIVNDAGGEKETLQKRGKE